MAQGQVYSSSGYGGGSWVNTRPQVQVVAHRTGAAHYYLGLDQYRRDPLEFHAVTEQASNT